ncbi:M20 family metallopeptidase [Bacillus pinisoli]|uniref:M20 family metallopeptidase n=1 Tax=Bacillus pinisoli TaxID=2901866 RepID=UPI001FF249EC|nr:M20 family metallopeptidase [Bacillus pinisoli]
MRTVTEIDRFIEENRDQFIKISDQIWSIAETRFEEYQSAELLCQALEAEDFQVERGVGGIETAFIASFGSGNPVVGILGEYDALSGLSQKKQSSNKESILQNGNGHGCGHNLFGASVFAAILAVKKMMIEQNLYGTIRFYGCPGEEGGSGKTFMVREGLFDDVDVALTWHPGNFTGMFTSTTLANYQVYFKFSGTASHAANSPHLGRSALDAVELMNVGVNYLREHIIPEARIHYAIVNSGGLSPNVVQSEAEVLYLIRAPQLNEVNAIFERVSKIARGAAMMTETEVNMKFDKACSNYIPNHTIGKLMQENLSLFSQPSYDEAEMTFANQMMEKITEDDLRSTISEVRRLYRTELPEQMKDELFFREVLPYYESTEIMFGSTDVGDVSWITPTAQFWGPCFIFGTPFHSWQLVSQGATSIAHKGMLYSGKVLAKTALDLFLQPQVIEDAKHELLEKRDGVPYVSPIPLDVKPSPLNQK